jgi:hypothetical protein
MSKTLYLVHVIRKESGEDGRALNTSASDPVDPDAARFVEAIRASNRREAWILVRRKYPEHLVLDKVMKAP